MFLRLYVSCLSVCLVTVTRWRINVFIKLAEDPRSSNSDHIVTDLCTGSEYRNTLNTFKLLQSSSPRYLRDLITVQFSQSTLSSTLVTLLQPSVDSSLKITNRSFRYAAPHLWNKLSPTLYVPYQFNPSWLSWNNDTQRQLMDGHGATHNEVSPITQVHTDVESSN